MKQNADRIKLDSQRNSAAKFFVGKYSREERYLEIYSRDCENYLKSSRYILSRDLANQFFFDFLVFFDTLKERMKEFGWSVDFLQAKGIDFVSLKNLYVAVA